MYTTKNLQPDSLVLDRTIGCKTTRKMLERIDKQVSKYEEKNRSAYVTRALENQLLKDESELQESTNLHQPAKANTKTKCLFAEANPQVYIKSNLVGIRQDVAGFGNFVHAAFFIEVLYRKTKEIAISDRYVK